MSKKFILMLAAAVLAIAIAIVLYDQAVRYRNASLPPSPCQLPFDLSDAAEKKPGGALYEGPIPKTMDEMRNISEMGGAHHVHAAQFGGELFMSKNKINHIETIYSEACGLRLIVYNAFTEPVRADRFMAFALLIPDGVDKPFVGVVFLEPSADGRMLQGRVGQELDTLLGAELYVKYPGDEVPEMFDVYLGDMNAILQK